MTARIRLQLAALILVSTVAAGYMLVDYIKVPAMMGVGRYTVTLQLPQSGGLYERANVTYRGTKIGQVQTVELTQSAVQAVLSLQTDVPIPSDLKAEVHSQNAIGEQYVALFPLDDTSAPLKDGDVIPADRTSVPPDINDLLDGANRGILAIPHDNLRTVIDESYVAFGGLGPELRRLVGASTMLASDAREDLDQLTALIDKAPPVLDSQSDTAGAVEEWSRHLASITRQLRDSDGAVEGILEVGTPAADEARALVQRLQPTLPVILSNLVSVADLAVVYHAGIEQLLVLVPQATAIMQGFLVPNLNTKQDFTGAYLDFNLNLNLPPACTTGFLPMRQMRSPTEVDAPERPMDDLYCRIPQDSPNNVRGARNTPCLTKPGKRAPTAKLCKSDEQYVPLNDGFNWKGDPNATLSGQDIPQGPPRDAAPDAEVSPAVTAPPPIAITPYDPATGAYIGPDGKVYRQGDLAANAPADKSWEDMLTPPP